MEEQNESNINKNYNSGNPISQDDRLWAMFAHLSALAGLLIPFGNIFGPLLIWILKKDTSEFVDNQGKESLNFQISITIYTIISIILVLLLIGIVVLILIGLFAVIMVIIAAINSYDGKNYKYPLTIRFVK